MLRTTLASLRHRAMRMALSCLAITAGVGFVAATLILGASMNQSFYNSFAALQHVHHPGRAAPA
ncbi:MAG: hypothetical protein ACRDPO_39650 [Streptosporangiaceae bacterium]